MYRIEKEKLPVLYRQLAALGELYLPVATAGKTNYALYHEDAQVDLNTLKTVKSPKDIFFPQSENLYSCTRQDGRLNISPDPVKSTPFVVFGVRGCDVQGLKVLDKVFLSDPVDSYYAARRKMGTLVSLACHRPESSCFCGSFGIDAAQPEGDVVAYLIEDFLYWKPVTEKGLALTEAVKQLLEETDGAAVTAEQTAIREILNRLPLKDLSLDGWGPQAAKTRFDSPLWESLSSACLACGTCTFVCPTCQCYDIKDYDTGKGVKRYRCWDSCMYSDFTMMAHGNNRTTQMQRFRQRFLHKLAYFPANNDGMFSCVGCGRCVDKCPSHLNIVKVIKAFEKEGK